MNYIKELNAFYNQIIYDPLSGSAILLWNALMHINNECGWRKEFSAPASIIHLKSGIKGATSFKRARDELQEKGYIHVRSRAGNQAPIYQMISQWNETKYSNKPVQTFYVQDANPTDTNHSPVSNNNEPAVITSADHVEGHSTGNDLLADNSSDHRKENNTVPSLTHSTDPLYKQNHTELKTKPKLTTTSDAICFYQQNFGVISSFVAEDITMWIKDIGESIVLHAMKRALEQNKATWSYVKAILKAWAKKGIATVEQANAEDTTFRNRKKRTASHAGNTSKEVVPDWFLKRKQQQAQDKQTKLWNMGKADPGQEIREREEFEQLLAEFRSN